ncbi:MAG: metallophosphoesterase [Planctomycetota bacterium]
MTRIAILADMHLTDNAATAQWAAFNDAVQTIASDRPDIVVFAGDATAYGNLNAARAVRESLDALSILFVSTPGNADIRDSKTSETVHALLTTDSVHTGDIIVHPLDSSEEISMDALDGLEALCRDHQQQTIVIVTHCPIESMANDARKRIAALLDSGSISLLIAGHTHRDEFRPYQIGVECVVRGLDPEKAIGGPPCLTLLTNDGAQRWTRQDVPFSAGDFLNLTADEKMALKRRIGLCALAEPDETLDYAIENSIDGIELRHNEKTDWTTATIEKLNRWRASGDRILSYHLPDIQFNPEDGRVENDSKFQHEIKKAAALGVQQLTLHVPDLPVALMRDSSPIRARALDYCVQSLSSADTQTMRIGIENMHLSEGQPSGHQRRFGCLPDECLDWIASLRAALGNERVGALIDIGHARNNPPFSKRIAISDWMSQLGGIAVGCHIHQVERTDAGLKNHREIHSAYGPLISLSGLVWSCRTKQLRDCPLFIEVRGFDARVRSYRKLVSALD